jgi:hypothetical protein
MTRRPPKDPLLALAYHLAYEAGQRQFRLEYPELDHLFRDEDKTAAVQQANRKRLRRNTEHTQ